MIATGTGISKFCLFLFFKYGTDQSRSRSRRRLFFNGSGSSQKGRLQLQTPDSKRNHCFTCSGCLRLPVPVSQNFVYFFSSNTDQSRSRSRRRLFFDSSGSSQKGRLQLQNPDSKRNHCFTCSGCLQLISASDNFPLQCNLE